MPVFPASRYALHTPPRSADAAASRHAACVRRLACVGAPRRKIRRRSCRGVETDVEALVVVDDALSMSRDGGVAVDMRERDVANCWAFQAGTSFVTGDGVRFRAAVIEE